MVYDCITTFVQIARILETFHHLVCLIVTSQSSAREGITPRIPSAPRLYGIVHRNGIHAHFFHLFIIKHPQGFAR
jgi:hypothetical protein